MDVDIGMAVAFTAGVLLGGAGGVFVMNVNVRSSYTVITTGMIRPASFFVLSLKSFVKATMFTPC